MSKLFFVGDSITAGAWDERGGWVNRLIGEVMRKTMMAEFEEGSFYCLPYNLGVSGNTVPDVIARLGEEISTRVDQTNKDEKIEVVIAIGVNDSVYMLEEDRPRFTDEEFSQNIQNLVNLVEASAVEKMHFIGLMPVNDDLLNPIPWAPEKAYINEHVKRFEKHIQDICQQQSLSFLPLHEKWMQMPDWKEHLIDGVHPNTKGHALLAKQIGGFLFDNAFESFHS